MPREAKSNSRIFLSRRVHSCRWATWAFSARKWQVIAELSPIWWHKWLQYFDILIWWFCCRRRLSPAGMDDCISQNTERCKILLIHAGDACFWQQSPTGGIRDSTIALTDISRQFILDTWSKTKRFSVEWMDRSLWGCRCCEELKLLFSRYWCMYLRVSCSIISLNDKGTKP